MLARSKALSSVTNQPASPTAKCWQLIYSAVKQPGNDKAVAGWRRRLYSTQMFTLPAIAAIASTLEAGDVAVTAAAAARRGSAATATAAAAGVAVGAGSQPLAMAAQQAAAAAAAAAAVAAPVQSATEQQQEQDKRTMNLAALAIPPVVADEQDGQHGGDAVLGLQAPQLTASSYASLLAAGVLASAGPGPLNLVAPAQAATLSSSSPGTYLNDSDTRALVLAASAAAAPPTAAVAAATARARAPHAASPAAGAATRSSHGFGGPAASVTATATSLGSNGAGAGAGAGASRGHGHGHSRHAHSSAKYVRSKPVDYATLHVSKHLNEEERQQLGQALAAVPGTVVSKSQLLMRPSRLNTDLGAIFANVKYFVNLVTSKTGVCAVLKGNAMGHGIGQCALVAEAAGARMVGVTDNWEIAAVREAGVKIPILRVRPAGTEEVMQVAHLNVHEICGSVASATAMSAAAAEAGVRIPIHIKTNVGGNRMSFHLPLQLDEIAQVMKLPGLKVAGIMTHFPCGSDYDATSAHLATFERDSASLLALIPPEERDDIMLHCCNTQATLTLPPRAHMDMVRIGGGLFGQEDNVTHLGLRPALSWTTSIVLVRKVPAGCSLGYGMSYTCDKDTVLATIPISYSHGLRQNLTDKSWNVLIHGVPCPLAGAMSMSMCTLDVTHLVEAGIHVASGDEAVVLGNATNEITGEPSCITAENMANVLGTYFDDVACAITAFGVQPTFSFESVLPPKKASS